MRPVFMIAALAFTLNMDAALAEEDHFAPAKAGKIECYGPDFERKTCTVMTRYEWDSSGKVFAIQDGIFSTNPMVAMRSRESVTIKAAETCYDVKKYTREDLTFMEDGVPLPEPRQLELLEKYSRKYTEFVGKTICVEFSPYGSIFITQLTIDGTEFNSGANRMAWISPEDGFTLEQ